MSRSGKSETEREKDREINISLHSGRIWFRFVNFAFFFLFLPFCVEWSENDQCSTQRFDRMVYI